MTTQEYNNKYKFISDGTWFVKGTQCKLICLYIEPQNDISYEQLVQNREQYVGIFYGLRRSENDCEINCGHMFGSEYMDEQGCGLDQFQILLRGQNDEEN